MSFPQDGRDMDSTAAGFGGSIRRAREQAMNSRLRPAPGTTAGPSRDAQFAPATGQSRIIWPQAAPALQTQDGQIGVAISRPTQVPQWRLRALLASPSTSEDSLSYRSPASLSYRSPASLSYRPPAGAQAPPRPPRPSRVPSILDGSKMQGLSVVPEALSPASFAPSHPSTLSSPVASIPNFPLPMPTAAGVLPRKSVNLGPPPSARRGASSFYPSVSYVPPILEESPSRTPQSRGSFASSAAIPESWGMPSTGSSGEEDKGDYNDVAPVYDMYAGGNDAEEDDSQRLVRNASIGKRARPTLVSTLSPRDGPSPEFDQRPGIVPLQFASGTGFRDFTDSSGTLPTLARMQHRGSMPDLSQSSSGTTDSSNDAPSLSSFPMLVVPPGGRAYRHLSAIRRPPQLDIYAVRHTEARGSLTSLPELIRRATRLAASLDRGMRPASGFDLNRDREEESSQYGAEKHQSGLSDMLAAFPPPARAPANTPNRSFRNSLRDQISSWPILFNSNNNTRSLHELPLALPSANTVEEKRRRRCCCGLPAWGFVLVVIGVLVLVTAAIVLPLEFLVIQKNKHDTNKSALARCQQQIDCANGGTNVVNKGFCSCICTDGFTGFDCTTPDATDCSTRSVTGNSGSIKNATVGSAISRLIDQAQANFSVVLDASTIISRFNAGNLSCSAQNALVTFDGEDTRVGDGSDEVFAQSPTGDEIVGGDVSSPGAGSAEATQCDASTVFATAASFSYSTWSVTDGLRTTPTNTSTTSSSSCTSSSCTSASANAGTASFIVTEEVLDFARVSVLFIVQEDNLADATTAQDTLQTFFTSADGNCSSSSSSSSGASIASAQNITLGNNNSVDLVDLIVDSGSAIGGDSDATPPPSPTSSSSSSKLLRHRRRHDKHVTPTPC